MVLALQVPAPLINPRVFDLIPLEYIKDHEFVIEADKVWENRVELFHSFEGTASPLFCLSMPQKRDRYCTLGIIKLLFIL